MHDQLLAEIAEHPTDEARWTVLLDWLIARGDPRGELAVASDPDASLREFAPGWFGAEARVEGGRVVVGGDPDKAFPGASSVVFEFDRGHIQRVRVNVVNGDHRSGRGGDEDWGADWLPALVRRALTQPVGRLVQTVEIRQPPDWSGDLRCDALLDALLAAAPLPIRTLTWGCAHDWEFVELPDCAQLLSAAPWLESLTLQGEAELTGPLRHPHLRTLALGGMQDDSLEPFTDADLPALEHLTVWLEFDDTREVEAGFDVDRLAPLMATPLPSLRTLSLPGCPQPNEIAAALVDAEWYAQLHPFSLSSNAAR